MTEATEKQINFAQSLGIENANQYTKEALKSMIDVALKNKSSTPSKPVQTEAGVQIDGHVSTNIQIIRNERANSYEFGKAGDRHKIYYSDVKDLQTQLDSLMTLRIPKEFSSESTQE